MKTTLVIQPIFCPNDAGFAVYMRSLWSWIEYINSDQMVKNSVTTVIGGYCKKDFYKRTIEELARAEGFECLFYDKNYGKAHIVNDLFNTFRTDQDYLLTFDSDIVFDPECKNIIPRLQEIKDKLISTKPLGMIALAQREQDCHLHNEFNNNIDVNGEKLHWANHGGGVAGGCLFMPCDAFKSVGCYRVMRNPYDGDDGFLLADLNKAGFFTAMCSTVWVIHPFGEIKEGYNAFKVKLRQSANGIRATEVEHNLGIEEANKFWDN